MNAGGIAGAQLMVVPERANTLLIPGIACPRSHTYSVERCRDLLIGEPAGHLTNDIQGLNGCAAPILTDWALFDPKLRMTATSPMDKQNDLSLLLIDINDDLADENLDDSLLQPHVRGRRVPNLRKILGQAQQQFLIWNQLWLLFARLRLKSAL